MEAMAKISLNEIKKKLSNKKAIIDFFRESGIYIFINNNIGYYYPEFSSFNYNFCLEVLAGRKKVIIFYLLIQ